MHGHMSVKNLFNYISSDISGSCCNSVQSNCDYIFLTLSFRNSVFCPHIVIVSNDSRNKHYVFLAIIIKNIYVLSDRVLCDGLITRPEESYRLWCVVVCDLETS